MPNILVKIPHASYPGAARQALAKAITAVAVDVEHVGDDPKQHAVTWVAIEELPAGAITAGGNDISDRILQCIVQAYIPAGVLNGADRLRYAQQLNAAFNACIPQGDQRMAIVSSLLIDMPEGTWGAGNEIWRLPDVTAAAGFKHLQSLVKKQ